MSNYHVKTMPRRDKLEVVFHFDIPDNTNFATYSLRTALKEYLEQDGTITSAYPNTNATELASLQNGAKYEETHTVEFDGKLTKAQKRDQVDSFWTARNNKVASAIEERLDFWGYDRDVP